MKQIQLLLVVLMVSLFATASAQDEWPKVINTSDGSVIKIYQPEPESFSGNILKSRAAISYLENGKTEPVFGTYWSVATLDTDRDNRRAGIQSVKVPSLKLSGITDASKISFIKTTLETELPKVENDLSLDELLASIDASAEEKKLSKNLNNNPPKIIYANQASLLVSIDGEPKYQRNDDWNADVVVNSPFTIIKNNDGYFLYGGKHWYSAGKVTGPYKAVTKVPGNLSKIADAVNKSNTEDPSYSDSATTAQLNTVSDIIVSTEPAELIQTRGEAHFVPISNTSLQYADNTSNDIFLDKTSGKYYVLIAGRWYTSKKMNSNWEYTAATDLPADFSKIPEGSAKDNVLASVAGTAAAREAVMDAQIPQTAKVDRHNASTTITYDGTPKFEDIAGTQLQYAVNTPNSVISYQGRYYSVDKGVWFVADNAMGPWTVATDRPDEVDAIPPSSPVYNIKYVYIYDVDPDWVYMGYTPGYLNSYIYGPTIVYGTGYYYRPWYGRHYYPRSSTWGFGFNYNPWLGWSFGYGFSSGWFNVGFGYTDWYGWNGGWWGPTIYRPPYAWGGYRGRSYYGGGYYGNSGYGGYGYGGRGGRGGYGGRGNTTIINNNTTIINNGGRNNTTINNIRNTNNIYNYSNAVITTNNGGRVGRNTTGIVRGQAQQENGGRNINNNPRQNPRTTGNQTTPVADGRIGGQTTGGRNNSNPRANNAGLFNNTPAAQEGNNANTPGNGGGRTNTTTTPAQGGRPGRQNAAAAPVLTDRSGNVYQRNTGGQWQQRDQQQWKPVTSNRSEEINNLNRQQQMQTRGQARTQNFETFRNGGNSARQQPASNGGGARPSAERNSGGNSRPSGGGGGGGRGRRG